MQIEKLEEIVAGKIHGREAIAVLRQARQDAAAAQDAAWKFSQLLGRAEGVLLYGPDGRPHAGGAFHA